MIVQHSIVKVKDNKVKEETREHEQEIYQTTDYRSRPKVTSAFRIITPCRNSSEPP